MALLSQNSKMKKSSQNGTDIYNFGIPAYKSETGLITCPQAKHCIAGCYARSGTYNFSNVKNAYENRLKATQSETFVDLMVAEINLKLVQSVAKDNTCLIRIHDSGDFYNMSYIAKWLIIMEKMPQCKFYAYTKQVVLFKEINRLKQLPNNFTVIYSFGGTEDSHIDTYKDRHARVFQNETDLLCKGYADGTNDDRIAAFGPNHRIGLIYHGVKNYANTTWSKQGV